MILLPWLNILIEETGTEFIQDFVNHYLESDNHQLITSGVTYAEVMTTFRRLFDNKRIDEPVFQEMISTFEKAWNWFTLSQLTDTLIKRSGALSLQVTLTGADAFQLASALEANTELFICSDKKLCDAADKNNLIVWNPTHGKFRPIENL